MPDSHTERPGERNAWDESDDRRCAEFLGRGRCALVAGHAGSHAPLPVLWQQAGYEDGEWSEAGLLASLERVEAERDRLKGALHEIALYTSQDGQWARHSTAGALAGTIHKLARASLEGS